MVELENYWAEFLLIASAHLFAVISPGPDFAVVSKHAVSLGRRSAIYTSLGVGCAILLHVSYTLIGMAVVIAQTPWLFELLVYLGAGYLCYIGVGAIRSTPAKTSDPEACVDLTQHAAANLSDWRCFVMGFMTNGLNPKVTLFFLALFGVVISSQTPTAIKLFYGFYMAIATTVWFCFLSMILTFTRVRKVLLNHGHWFERSMGIILILLAIKLVFSSLYN